MKPINPNAKYAFQLIRAQTGMRSPVSFATCAELCADLIELDFQEKYYILFLFAVDDLNNMKEEDPVNSVFMNTPIYHHETFLATFGFTLEENDNV